MSDSDNTFMIQSPSYGRKEKKYHGRQLDVGDPTEVIDCAPRSSSNGETLVANSITQPTQKNPLCAITATGIRRERPATRGNQFPVSSQPINANKIFEERRYDITMQIPPAAILLQESMMMPLFQDYPVQLKIVHTPKEEYKHVRSSTRGTTTHPWNESNQPPPKKSKPERGTADPAKDTLLSSHRVLDFCFNDSQANSQGQCCVPVAAALAKAPQSIFAVATAASKYSASESSEKLISLNQSSHDDDQDKNPISSSKGSLLSSSLSTDSTEEKNRTYKQKQHPTDIKWNQRFQDLCKYKMTYGHVNVPYTYQENPSLARWVKRQRHQYRLLKDGQGETMHLSLDRIQALEKLGFKWDIPADVWNERLAELKAYKAKYKSCDVPCRFAENPQLAIWVKCQRRQFRLYTEGQATSITGERIRELEALGFNWVLRKYKNRGNKKEN